MQRFGVELCRRTRAAGIGPRRLSQRTGLDEETVAALESGARLPASEDDLRRILIVARATPAQVEQTIRIYREIAVPSPGSPASVFLSYRRADEPAFAGRLYDRMAARVGESRVFMDVDSIDLGRDFVEVLDEALARCAVLLAVVGPRWLTATRADGTRCIDDPGDFVRLEIERALSRAIPVIPVLVDGVPMPTEADLPGPLAAFARRQARPVSHARFGADCAIIESVVERELDDLARR